MLFEWVQLSSKLSVNSKLLCIHLLFRWFVAALNFGSSMN